MKILRGDVRDIAATLDAESFDGCLCDPPYGLSFMGKKWDYDVPSVETWAAVLGALKPGAHLLAFAGTRTQHRMAVRIEDAGFEIRDMIAWVYGSGFPKSLDVSKAIDKAAGTERVRIMVPSKAGNSVRRGSGEQGVTFGDSHGGFTDISEPVTDAARQWDGWGTALKPALEPITVARKPLEGTVAENVQKWGTGALNVDGCRVETDQPHPCATMQGRWPANLIHDGSEEVLAEFPESKGALSVVKGDEPSAAFFGKFGRVPSPIRADSGSAARFFYCAKASRSEREAGLREAGLREAELRGLNASPTEAGNERKPIQCRNYHPTVKPIALAEYLARLILPPKRDTPRRLLVPFSGSGSEVIGALRAGWDEVVGIELSPEYAEIAEARIAHWMQSYQSELVEAV